MNAHRIAVVFLEDRLLFDLFDRDTVLHGKRYAV